MKFSSAEWINSSLHVIENAPVKEVALINGKKIYEVWIRGLDYELDLKSNSKSLKVNKSHWIACSSKQWKVEGEPGLISDFEGAIACATGPEAWELICMRSSKDWTLECKNGSAYINEMKAKGRM